MSWKIIFLFLFPWIAFADFKKDVSFINTSSFPIDIEIHFCSIDSKANTPFYFCNEDIPIQYKTETFQYQKDFSGTIIQSRDPLKMTLKKQTSQNVTLESLLKNIVILNPNKDNIEDPIEEKHETLVDYWGLIHLDKSSECTTSSPQFEFQGNWDGSTSGWLSPAYKKGLIASGVTQVIITSPQDDPCRFIITAER